MLLVFKKGLAEWHKERGLFEASGPSVKLKDKDGFVSTHPGGLSYPLM